jgi:hypothetical protein
MHARALRRARVMVRVNLTDVREDMVRMMRQEEMARPGRRAAEIERAPERYALLERLLREDRCDDVLARADGACLEQAESLAEWERNAAGPVPCMRVAPWKGNGHDGDRE